MTVHEMKLYIWVDGWLQSIIFPVLKVEIDNHHMHVFTDRYIGVFVNGIASVKYELRGVAW
jgi:hypothetical protein